MLIRSLIELTNKKHYRNALLFTLKNEFKSKNKYYGCFLKKYKGVFIVDIKVDFMFIIYMKKIFFLYNKFL